MQFAAFELVIASFNTGAQVAKLNSLESQGIMPSE
jgi:hypothetical protein